SLGTANTLYSLTGNTFSTKEELLGRTLVPSGDPNAGIALEERRTPSTGGSRTADVTDSETMGWHPEYRFIDGGSQFSDRYLMLLPLPNNPNSNTKWVIVDETRPFYRFKIRGNYAYWIAERKVYETWQECTVGRVGNIDCTTKYGYVWRWFVFSKELNFFAGSWTNRISNRGVKQPSDVKNIEASDKKIIWAEPTSSSGVWTVTYYYTLYSANPDGTNKKPVSQAGQSTDEHYIKAWNIAGCNVYWQLCLYRGGCSDEGAYLGESHTSTKCLGGNVYWMDSCGKEEEIKEVCGNPVETTTSIADNSIIETTTLDKETCENGACVGKGSLVNKNVLRDCGVGLASLEGCQQCIPGETQKINCNPSCEKGGTKTRNCNSNGVWGEWPNICEGGNPATCEIKRYHFEKSTTEIIYVSKSHAGQVTQINVGEVSYLVNLSSRSFSGNLRTEILFSIGKGEIIPAGQGVNHAYTKYSGPIEDVSLELNKPKQLSKIPLKVTATEFKKTSTTIYVTLTLTCEDEGCFK
ncbi:MAG: hypothetical protein AABW88_05675, partial [Nanoarchaeota archaeon]